MMFAGFGISLPICWAPGLEFTAGRFRAWWLIFEVAVFRDDLQTGMLKFHVEQIKDELKAGSVTYYDLNTQRREP